ncbi:hypothetical protein H7Y40_00290 [Pedobacter sp.]|nr:hypothetical protein [Candidatus Saccharibacteria bacterium]
MSRDYFVNRHGKKSTVDTAVSEIATQESAAPAVFRPSVLVPKVRRSLPRLHISRRISLGVAVGVAVVAILGLLVIDSARRDYQLQTAEMKSSVQKLATQTASTETSAQNAIKGLSSQLTAKSVCAGTGTVITTIYAPAQQAADECARTAVAYNNVKASLTSMNDVVIYLDAVKVALATALAAPTDGSFAEIPAKALAWQESYDTVKKLTPPQQASVAHDYLQKKIQTVSDAWKKLSIAQGTQNTEAFTAAEAKLTKAYEELRTTGDEFDVVVLNVQKDIHAAVQNLR